MADNDIKMMGAKPQKPNEEENEMMAGVKWHMDEDEDHIMGDKGLPPNEEEDLNMETDAEMMELEQHRKNEQVEEVNMESDDDEYAPGCDEKLSIEEWKELGMLFAMQEEVLHCRKSLVHHGIQRTG